MREKWHQLMDEYEERFGEDFPNEPSDMSIEEQIELMEKCLNDGKPYDPMKGLPPDAIL